MTDDPSCSRGVDATNYSRGENTTHAGALCVTLRTRLLRTAAIAACGGAVLLGKHQRKPDYEQLGFRAVPIPLVAWAAHAIGIAALLDAIARATLNRCVGSH